MYFQNQNHIISLVMSGQITISNARNIHSKQIRFDLILMDALNITLHIWPQPYYYLKGYRFTSRFNMIVTNTQLKDMMP